MIEEPYRWVEAVNNRREYIRDQLKNGSPIVGLPYSDGILLLTIGHERQKVYEIYDRIAFAAIGHPADIEKLRIIALDLASVEGFTRAAADVSLRRLVSYGIGPTMKSAFDQIFNAPFVARLMLAELGAHQDNNVIARVEYDGSFTDVGGVIRHIDGAFQVLGPTSWSEKLMRACLKQEGLDTDCSLNRAMETGLLAWAAGIVQRENEEDTAEPSVPEESELKRILRDALRNGMVEAVVLDRKLSGESKFRRLDAKEAISGVKGLT